MILENTNNVYLIGIGGIGMSALARWFNAQGKNVAGYDKTESDLTRQLAEEGIRVHYQDSVSEIPADLMDERESTLIIYTPAIPSEHSELNYLRGEGFKVMKRSEALGMITGDLTSVAVAGTHGKTTTTSMVAHLLKHAGLNCSAFVGGISKNYNSNVIINETEKDNAIVVMEADEYDRSFLRLRPDISVITTIDPDHLDIYENERDFEDTFNEFVKCIKDGGSLIYNNHIGSKLKTDKKGINYFTYGLNKGECHGYNLRIVNGIFIFDYEGVGNYINDISLKLPGYHNVENAVGAISVALLMGVDPDVIREGIKTYEGVNRRFDIHIRTEDLVFLDDYAHHPSELNALTETIRLMFPGKKCHMIFQPHLFSRTKDFMNEFANSLSRVDRLSLLDIYPARETPIEGVNSSVLLDKIDLEEKELVSKDQLLMEIGNSDADVIVTVGAGDIELLVEPIKERLGRNALVKE